MNIFKALSDPIRREILLLLKDGERTAGEIAERFDRAGATVSYHLSLLKEADLVYERKYKNFIFYGINTSVFEQFVLWLSQFQGGKHE